MDRLLEDGMKAMSKTKMGPIVTTAMFVWLTVPQLSRWLDCVTSLGMWSEKLLGNFNPFMTITFLDRSAFFVNIESYLSAICSGAARCLRAELGDGKSDMVFSLNVNQELVDRFEGTTLRWSFMSEGDPRSGETRSYVLTFRRRHRRLVVEKYLRFVMEKGKELMEARRQRRLYTNNISGGYCEGNWSYVPFEHPASFQTLAMNPSKKEELVKDLLNFRESRDYYARVGRAWKRGYLLYGPPGTGKSSLIAAMANFLEYDVYDLELTAVYDNSRLRGLLNEVRSKSIVVVEDIDCSLDLAGKRKGPKELENREEQNDEEERGNKESESESRVTLSGLLNFVDGLWSASAGERIIVFTTNYVDQLDSALIRPGRMDMLVELSYCRFEAFKLLARNYLEVEEHPLFADVGRLIEEVDITPADVAEQLMRGSRRGGARVAERLQALVRKLEDAREGSKWPVHRWKS